MSWQVRFTNRALKDLKRLDQPNRDRVLEGIERHAETETGDVKPVKGRPGTWRLRVGDWRIFHTYEPDGRLIAIVRVLHRSQAYDRGS